MAEQTHLQPSEVREVLARHVLTDGMKLVLDLRRSRGSRLLDAQSGQRYLDMYTFFASAPLGLNPPGIADDPTFMAELAEIAVNKPANPDMYSTDYAEFVETFVRVLGDPALPHLFFIEGGALAVENALKVAFDWKSRKNEAAGRDRNLGTQIMHLTHAFHGRSGYTLSLTNTEPNKTDRFPKFNWPRIDVPAITHPLSDHLEEVIAAEERALRQAELAFAENPHDIAGFIAEPIQGEGGDNHMRPEFLQAMLRARALPRCALHSGRGADRSWHHRNCLGVPAAGYPAGCRRVLQEGAGRRHHGRRPGRRGTGQRVQGLRTDQLHLGWRASRHGSVTPGSGDHRGRGPHRAGGAEG